MKPLSIFAGLLTWLFSACIGGHSRTLLHEAQHDGHKLSLFNERTIIGLGAESNAPRLAFEGKEVPDMFDPFPMFLVQYPDWVVKTYADKNPDTQTLGMNVYVSPKQFSLQQFEQMTACYEQERSAFDNSLVQKYSNGASYVYYFSHFVYGDPPKPLFFKPPQQRFLPAYPQHTICEEYIKIEADGRWNLKVSSTNGKGDSFGGDVVSGQLVITEGVARFDTAAYAPFRPQVQKVRPEAAHLSELEYLRSFRDDQGRLMTEFFPL